MSKTDLSRIKPRLSSDEPLGFYDRAEEEVQEDLWFLPDTDPEEGEAAGAWLPGEKPKAEDPITEWRKAGEGLAVELAELAFDQGRLFERIRMMGQGAVARLAQAEAASLSWWIGDRISADRLALWQAFRIGATGEDAQGLARSAWASRMLVAPRGRLEPTAHFGSEAIELLLQEIDTAYRGLKHLHPVIASAFLFHHWRRLEERPDHLRDIEAAVIAARYGVGPERELPYLPISLTGFGGLSASGTVEQRLALWISSVHQAVLSALMTLERLQLWRQRAEEGTKDLSGRTPARLVACLMQNPVVAAPMAEQETGASRAAVQRNLDILMSRGLIREITGQGRFRLWAVAT